MKYRRLTASEKQDLRILGPENNNYKYILLEPIHYHSDRYNKDVDCEEGMLSDGATKAIDYEPEAFFPHDKLCNTGKWADGTPCTNFQASTVYSSILWAKKRWWQAIYRWPATWLFGGGEARKVGMW